MTPRGDIAKDLAKLSGSALHWLRDRLCESCSDWYKGRIFYGEEVSDLRQPWSLSVGVDAYNLQATGQLSQIGLGTRFHGGQSDRLKQLLPARPRAWKWLSVSDLGNTGALQNALPPECTRSSAWRLARESRS